MSAQDWVTTAAHDYFDILISTENSSTSLLTQYFHILHHDGILIQLTGSPFHVQQLKSTQHDLLAADFKDVITLSFPQPDYPTGSRSALLAKKTHIFKKIREKDIFNKSFSTRYYNFDVHKAALVA